MLDREMYEPVAGCDVNVGDIVIAEQKKFHYSTGELLGSDFYRCIVRKGAWRMLRLYPLPSKEFPDTPIWLKGWVEAANDLTFQMWRRK